MARTHKARTSKGRKAAEQIKEHCRWHWCDLVTLSGLLGIHPHTVGHWARTANCGMEDDTADYVKLFFESDEYKEHVKQYPRQSTKLPKVASTPAHLAKIMAANGLQPVWGSAPFNLANWSPKEVKARVAKPRRPLPRPDLVGESKLKEAQENRAAARAEAKQEEEYASRLKAAFAELSSAEEKYVLDNIDALLVRGYRQGEIV